MIELEIPLAFQDRLEASNRHLLFKSGNQLFSAMISTQRNPAFKVRLSWVRREEMYERKEETYKIHITYLEEDESITATTTILDLKKLNERFMVYIPQAFLEKKNTESSKIVVNITISQRRTAGSPNAHQPDLIRDPAPR